MTGRWKLFLGGDFIPTESEPMPDDWRRVVDADSRRFVTGHSLRIVNLEVPIGTPDTRIPKAGPTLHARAESIDFLEELGIDAVNLANNHVGDLGAQGVRATVQALGDHGLGHFGAGSDIQSASKPWIADIDGVSVAMIGATEQQFGAASSTTPGVRALGEVAVIGQVRRLASEYDIVIVAVHGGEEWCPWPPPARTELLRSFIDAGATVVMGHHPHIPQGFEQYSGGWIFYGLGSIWTPHFGSWSDRSNYDWGLAASIEFQGDNPVSVELSATNIRADGQLSIAPLDAKQTGYMKRVTDPLDDAAELESLWQEVSMRMYESERSSELGWRVDSISGSLTELIKISISRSGLFPSVVANRLRARHQQRWLSLVSNSRRKLLETALGLLSGELPDLRTSESSSTVSQMMPWLGGSR